MTVPLDEINDIREMDAVGVPRAEIARRLSLSRNTVAKYADMADMSPAAPEARPRARRALGPEDAAWIDAVLEADLGAPRKQRHTAKRIYDRLVGERGYEGSYSTVQRRVRAWRDGRRAGAGYLELEWAPGTAQADFGNFEADMAGERLALKLLVVSLPHSNARYARACMSQRSECMCEGLSRIFEQVGRAPAALVLDNATEAGRMSRGEVTESRLFSLFRAHYRCASRYCNPYSGNEKGSVENAVGFIRRNLLVPVPSVGSLEELNGLLAAGCERLNAASRCRDGRPVAEALAEDLAAMAALPADPFDAVRWVRARADKRGYVTVDGREYVAGPAWHSRELLVGVRAATVEILADRGRRAALLPRAWGAGGPVRNPLSLVPALVARPRAFGESTIRRDMPAGLVEAVDRMDAAGRRQTLRSISRAAEASGFEAACGAALRAAGAQDLRRVRLVRGLVAQDLRRVRLVRGLVARRPRPGGPAVALVPRAPGGPRAHGRRRHGQDPHGERLVPAGLRQAPGGPLLHRLLARDAPAPRPRRGKARPGGVADRPGGAARHRRAGLPAARRRRGAPRVPSVRRRLRATVGRDHHEPGVLALGVGLRRRPDGGRGHRPHRAPRQARPVQGRVVPRAPCPDVRRKCSKRMHTSRAHPAQILMHILLKST